MILNALVLVEVGVIWACTLQGQLGLVRAAVMALLFWTLAAYYWLRLRSTASRKARTPLKVVIIGLAAAAVALSLVFAWSLLGH
jgi:predicted membrane-bound spermidine synthase